MIRIILYGVALPFFQCMLFFWMNCVCMYLQCILNIDDDEQYSSYLKLKSARLYSNFYINILCL